MKVMKLFIIFSVVFAHHWSKWHQANSEQSILHCRPKDVVQQSIMLFLYISDGMCFAPCHSSGSDCGPVCGRLRSRMASDTRRCKWSDSRLAGADTRFAACHLFLSSSLLKEEREIEMDKQRGKNDRLDSPKTSFSHSDAPQKIKEVPRQTQKPKRTLPQLREL